MCFIISDAAVLRLKMAVSEEIQIHIAELTSRKMKRIHNLGSKIKMKKKTKNKLTSNTSYYTASNQDYSATLVFILGN